MPLIQERLHVLKLCLDKSLPRYNRIHLTYNYIQKMGFPGGISGKESACQCTRAGSIPGPGRSHGGEHGNLLQYSCLGNPMERGAWWAIVHGVAKH